MHFSATVRPCLSLFDLQVLKSRFKVGALIMQQKVGSEISEKYPCLPIMQNRTKYPKL